MFLVRAAGGRGVELATPSLDCAILPGTTRSWLLGWAARVGLRPVEGAPRPATTSRGADEAFLCSSVAGILPVTRFDGRADRRRPAGAVDAARPGRPRGDDPRPTDRAA